MRINTRKINKIHKKNKTTKRYIRKRKSKKEN